MTKIVELCTSFLDFFFREILNLGILECVIRLQTDYQKGLSRLEIFMQHSDSNCHTYMRLPRLCDVIAEWSGTDGIDVGLSCLVMILAMLFVGFIVNNRTIIISFMASLQH